MASKQAKKPSPSKKHRTKPVPAKVEAGRPPEYDEVPCCRTARKILALEGTETDVAIALGVSRKALYDWKAKYPAFAQAVAEGKSGVDRAVVRTLVRMAVGKVKVRESKVVNKELVVVDRLLPPDLGAVALWLKNRMPDEFRDKQTVEHEGAVPATVSLYVPSLESAPESFRQFLESASKAKVGNTEE